MILVGLLFSCAGPAPLEDYTLARAAYMGAKSAESARFAPGLWYKGEEAYKKAQQLFEERYYTDAKKQFNMAIQLFEKAEDASRELRLKSGEVLE